MQTNMTNEKIVRLAVIVTEFGAAANIGGSPETKVRTFDLPKEIADYITLNRGQWSTVVLGVEDVK
jgi:hypothetical protein